VENIYNRLVYNTSAYSGIHCYKLALGNQNGVQFFYVSEGASDASSSLLEPQDHLTDHPDTAFNNKIEVQTVTLDDWANQNNITKIDLLWLDMQGFELAMLKASKHILKSVSAIHTEVSTKETYKGVGLYKDYRAFLEEQGFTAVVEAIPEKWDMGNVLFVRK
jgi:FkbM family methyltransferase